MWAQPAKGGPLGMSADKRHPREDHKVVANYFQVRSLLRFLLGSYVGALYNLSVAFPSMPKRSANQLNWVFLHTALWQYFSKRNTVDLTVNRWSLTHWVLHCCCCLNRASWGFINEVAAHFFSSNIVAVPSRGYIIVSRLLQLLVWLRRAMIIMFESIPGSPYVCVLRRGVWERG